MTKHAACATVLTESSYKCVRKVYLTDMVELRKASYWENACALNTDTRYFVPFMGPYVNEFRLLVLKTRDIHCMMRSFKLVTKCRNNKLCVYKILHLFLGLFECSLIFRFTKTKTNTKKALEVWLSSYVFPKCISWINFL